jgi:hypothetical protein
MSRLTSHEYHFNYKKRPLAALCMTPQARNEISPETTERWP